ncbi:MAG: VWA domain-containing protein, partial [Bryobacteraceae bacterium]
MVEFFVLAGALGALITALYLADRKRQKRVVSTLRFWQTLPAVPRRRKFARVREPWSLALQLASLVLLLLAIAHLEWGTRPGGRDYVLILDTSAWTGEASAGQTLLAREKEIARKYLGRLSASDRVLLVRADALVSPATPFTSNRKELRQAIQASVTAPRALNLNRALAFAHSAENESRNPGGMVYIGPGMISGGQVNAGRMRNLRVIELHASRENCGIRRIAAQRNPAPNWQVSVSVKNYDAKPHTVVVRAAFAGRPLPARSVSLGAGEERQAEFALKSNASGRFTAQIELHDRLSMDDRAALELPASPQIRVAIFTDRPQVLEPLFGGAGLAPVFYSPSAYRADLPADVMIFDRFGPSRDTAVPALWIDPPLDQSPLPVRAEEPPSEITKWRSSSALTAGLSENLALPQTKIFQIFPGDLAVASTPEGPVVVARPDASGRPKCAVIGFDPFAKPLRFQVATPLLVANLLHWLAPAAFGNTWDVEAAPYGSVGVAAARHVVHADLPAVAQHAWKPPAGTRTGLPPRHLLPRAPDTLWKWFAVSAAILLALEWFLFGRKKRAYGRLAVKIACLAAIAWALEMPAIQARAHRVAAAVLVDQSESIRPAERARASSLAAAIRGDRAGNWVQVIPFASGSAANETDLERALLKGAASLPDGYVPRLILVSDGNENEGSAARAIAELKPLHVSVDTIPLTPQSGTALRIMSANMPQHAYTGARIPIEVHVQAPQSGPGTVELRADGKLLGEHAIRLRAGVNEIHLQARIHSTGVAEICVRISEGSRQALFARALSLRRGHVLYISGDPPGSGENLLSTLEASGLQVTQKAAPLAAALSRVQLIVLNDVSLNFFTPDEKQEIANYVEGGGGLLLIGGGREVYRAQAEQDPLGRVLPATVAPPRGKGGTAVALIIDKSSSMEGRKMRLARLSAIGVVDHLRPRDLIGVLMFDNSYRWAVSMRRATDKPQIDRSIAGITPDGGTQIAPALAEAYRKVLAVKATYKHIVLLTDGISEAGDSFQLARDALLHHVTISTVGLGLDVNREYLDKVARISGGHSYVLDQPKGLKQIVLRDVKKFTGSSAVEEPLKPIVDRQAQILDGVGMDSAPALKGYTRFVAKPEAETILSIDPVRKDPLYVEWQYGLGRAAVFSSDAKSRWADSWIGWAGFDKFWINVSRELLKQPRNSAHAVYDSADDDIAVRYRMPPDVSEPATPPEMFAIGSAGFEKPVHLEKAAPRLYYGRVHVGKATGLIRIRPVADSAAFPETGVYRGDLESRAYGANERLLRRIAAQTGGDYAPSPDSVFDSHGRF